jgi:DNA-binding response OmpR family regulator
MTCHYQQEPGASMRIRKLLLIHPSRSIRALIKKYIFSELSDIEVNEADSGQQALDQTRQKNYDVIIAAEQLKDTKLKQFKTDLETTAPNGHTPLIIISESESVHARNHLVQQGFDRVVQIRLRPADLIAKINAVCNPRQWRKDARYHIPNASVMVLSSGHRNPAALINISKGGVLVEMDTDTPSTLLLGELCLELNIPIPGSTAVVKDLKAKLLRIEAVAWTSNYVPKTLRGTFVFTDLKSEARGKLEELMQMAKEDKLVAKEVGK